MDDNILYDTITVEASTLTGALGFGNTNYDMIRCYVVDTHVNPLLFEFANAINVGESSVVCNDDELNLLPNRNYEIPDTSADLVFLLGLYCTPLASITFKPTAPCYIYDMWNAGLHSMRYPRSNSFGCSGSVSFSEPVATINVGLSCVNGWEGTNTPGWNTKWQGVKMCGEYNSNLEEDAPIVIPIHKPYNGESEHTNQYFAMGCLSGGEMEPFIDSFYSVRNEIWGLNEEQKIFGGISITFTKLDDLIQGANTVIELTIDCGQDSNLYSFETTASIPIDAEEWSEFVYLDNNELKSEAFTITNPNGYRTLSPISIVCNLDNLDLEPQDTLKIKELFSELSNAANNVVYAYAMGGRFASSEEYVTEETLVNDETYGTKTYCVVPAERGKFNSDITVNVDKLAVYAVTGIGSAISGYYDVNSWNLNNIKHLGDIAIPNVFDNVEITNTIGTKKYCMAITTNDSPIDGGVVDYKTAFKLGIFCVYSNETPVFSSMYIGDTWDVMTVNREYAPWGNVVKDTIDNGAYANVLIPGAAGIVAVEPLIGVGGEYEGEAGQTSAFLANSIENDIYSELSGEFIVPFAGSVCIVDGSPEAYVENDVDITLSARKLDERVPDDILSIYLDREIDDSVHGSSVVMRDTTSQITVNLLNIECCKYDTNSVDWIPAGIGTMRPDMNDYFGDESPTKHGLTFRSVLLVPNLDFSTENITLEEFREMDNAGLVRYNRIELNSIPTIVNVNRITDTQKVTAYDSDTGMVLYPTAIVSGDTVDDTESNQVTFDVPAGSYVNMFFSPEINMAEVVANVCYGNEAGGKTLSRRLVYLVYDEKKFNLTIDRVNTVIDTKGEVVRALVTVNIYYDGINLSDYSIPTEDSQLDIQWDIYYGNNPNEGRITSDDGLKMATMDLDSEGEPVGTIGVCNNGGWGHRSARITFNNNITNISGKTLTVKASLVIPDRSNWNTTGKVVTNVSCYMYANVHPFEYSGYDLRLWLPDYTNIIPGVSEVYDYYRPISDNNGDVVYGMLKKSPDVYRAWYDKSAIIYNGTAIYKSDEEDNLIEFVNAKRYIYKIDNPYMERKFTESAYPEQTCDTMDSISEDGTYRYVVVSSNGNRFERTFVLRFVPEAAYSKLSGFATLPKFYYENDGDVWHQSLIDGNWDDAPSATPSAYVSTRPIDFYVRADHDPNSSPRFFYYYEDMGIWDGLPEYRQLYTNDVVVDGAEKYVGTLNEIGPVGEISIFYQKNFSVVNDTGGVPGLIDLPVYRWKLIVNDDVDIPEEELVLNIGCDEIEFPPTAINPYEIVEGKSRIELTKDNYTYHISDGGEVSGVQMWENVGVFTATLKIDNDESMYPLIIKEDDTVVQWETNAYTNDGMYSRLWGPARNAGNPIVFTMESDYSPELLYHVTIGSSTRINLNASASYALDVKSRDTTDVSDIDEFNAYMDSLKYTTFLTPSLIEGRFNLNTTDDVFFYTETPIIKKYDKLIILDGNEDVGDWPYKKYIFALGDVWSGTWTQEDGSRFMSIEVPSGVLSAVGAYSLSVTACRNENCNGVRLVKEIPNFVNVTLSGNTYDNDMFREFSDVELAFPYDEHSLWLPPNEWLTSDNFNLMIGRLEQNFNYLVKNSMYYNKSPMSVIGKIGDYRFAGVRRFGTNRDISDNPMITTDSTIQNAKDIFIDYNERLVYIANGPNITVVDMYRESNAVRAVISVDSVGIEYDRVDAVVTTSYGDILALIGDSNRVLGFGAYNGADNDLKCQYLFEFGDLGGRSAKGKFNAPTDMAIDSNDVVYILDAGNRCIKKLTYSGSWIATIPIPDELFGDGDTAKSLCVNDFGIFVLIGEIVVKFDQDGTVVDVWPLVDTRLTSLKIRSMANVGYLYVVYDTVVVKYSNTGGRSSRIHMDNNGFRSAVYSSNGSLMLLHDTYADCCVDGLVKHSIADENYLNRGLLWSMNDIYVKPNENIQDIVVNTAFQRFYDNIRIFMGSIKQHLRYEENDLGEPMFSVYDFDIKDIQLATKNIKDQIFVGINELVTADVINRCVSKLYECMTEALKMIS